MIDLDEETGDDDEGCGHPECEEISARLKVISETHSFAEYEEALYTLGYCAPRHSDEADYGDMPINAEKWIDPQTMPETARRLRQQRNDARLAEEAAIREEEDAEVRKEMEQDRLLDQHLISEWEKLMSEAEKRELTKTEKRDVFYHELHFGGRDKLIAHRDRNQKQKS